MSQSDEVSNRNVRFGVFLAVCGIIFSVNEDKDTHCVMMCDVSDMSEYELIETHFNEKLLNAGSTKASGTARFCPSEIDCARISSHALVINSDYKIHSDRQ